MLGEGDESFKPNPRFIIFEVIASYWYAQYNELRPSEQNDVFVQIILQHGGSGISRRARIAAKMPVRLGCCIFIVELSWPGLVREIRLRSKAYLELEQIYLVLSSPTLGIKLL